MGLVSSYILAVFISSPLYRFGPPCDTLHHLYMVTICSRENTKGEVAFFVIHFPSLCMSESSCMQFLFSLATLCEVPPRRVHSFIDALYHTDRGTDIVVSNCYAVVLLLEGCQGFHDVLRIFNAWTIHWHNVQHLLSPL